MAEEGEKAEDQKSDEAAEKPKRKISLPLVALALQAVIMIGAGGLILKATFFGKKPPIVRKKMAERAIASVEDDLSKVKLIAIPEFTINVGQKKVIRANLSIEVSNDEVEAMIKKRLPAVIYRIHSTVQRTTGHVNLDRVQGKLQLKVDIRDSINEELREQKFFNGMVRDVYFLEFVAI